MATRYQTQPGVPPSEGRLVFDGRIKHDNVRIYHFDNRPQVNMIIESTVGDDIVLVKETWVYTLTYDTSAQQVIHIHLERKNPKLGRTVTAVDQSSDDPMHKLSLLAQTEVYQDYYALAEQQRKGTLDERR